MSKLTQRMSRTANEDLPAIQPGEAVAAELAGLKDAGEKPAGEKLAPATMPANPSRESVNVAVKQSGKIKKEKGSARKKGHGEKEDRDCVVM